jgi:hypothetical protein
MLQQRFSAQASLHFLSERLKFSATAKSVYAAKCQFGKRFKTNYSVATVVEGLSASFYAACFQKRTGCDTCEVQRGQQQIRYGKTESNPRIFGRSVFDNQG